MKVVWIIVGGIVIGALVVGGFFMMKKQPSTQPVELAPIVSEPTPTSEPQLQTYQNTSGFSFQHPSTVEVKENEVDAASYANLTISSSDKEGLLKIMVVDTKLKNNAAWIKANKIIATDTTDVKLGDIDALTIEKGDTRLVSIDKGVLYTFTVTSTEESSEYWNSLVDSIVSSWTFKLPEEPTKSAPQKSNSTAPDSSGDIYEEETVE
jgi:hypothetical protein